jgi:predicted metal-dependent hydrolase
MHPLLRFTLGLFEEKQAKEPDGQAGSAINLIAKGVNRHPRANRETTLCHTLVAYEFKRSARRTIGFSIKPEGLVVSAPNWVALKAIEAALQEKAVWIIQKLGDVQERHQSQLANEITWMDGVQLPYLGAPLTVHLKPPSFGRRATTALLPNAPEAPVAASLTLQLALSLEATPVQMRQATQRWLLAQAQAHFTQRLDHFAPQLQVNWRSLSLSNAATRWGSARNDGSIRLNWRLMHFAPPIIDYVVAHELSHLREMNHSPRFWATVHSVMPDYAVRRQQLKESSVPRWS